ncbi:hypothetical protein D3C79_516720 [compost metagenome]
MIFYRIIWLLVLLPTFVVSAFFMLMGVAALMGMATEGLALGHWSLALLLLCGGVGLLTLSRLDNHFRNGAPLGDLRLHLAGLASGALVAITLLFLVPGQWLSLWPLLAAGYFLVRICRL